MGRKGGKPAVGQSAEEASKFMKLMLKKAGFPPLKILVKLLKERSRPRFGS